MHGPAVGFCVAIVTGTCLPVAAQAVIGGQDSPGERGVHGDVYEDTIM
jgi:hypothetical protein